MPDTDPLEPIGTQMRPAEDATPSGESGVGRDGRPSPFLWWVGGLALVLVFIAVVVLLTRNGVPAPTAPAKVARNLGGEGHQIRHEAIAALQNSRRLV
jgi:hypothetical protein